MIRSDSLLPCSFLRLLHCSFYSVPWVLECSSSVILLGQILRWNHWRWSWRQRDLLCRASSDPYKSFQLFFVARCWCVHIEECQSWGWASRLDPSDDFVHEHPSMHHQIFCTRFRCKHSCVETSMEADCHPSPSPFGKPVSVLRSQQSSRGPIQRCLLRAPQVQRGLRLNYITGIIGLWVSNG